MACAILIPPALYVLFAASSTLRTLNIVEAERDHWQRPADVLRALDVREGSRVIDFGSGAGYFTLKLAAAAGSHGNVAAVDLRKLSLFFLRVRALLRNQHNIEIIVAAPNDPKLPAGRDDAVLICNTYHEFADPGGMLEHTFRALRPGGRLVIVDRAPDAADEHAGHGHEVAPALVEAEVRRRGFQIVRRDDRFIERPGDDSWWLLVATRP